MANFTKLPNFIRQTSYNSTTIVSILTFSPNFIRQINFLHFRQTFLPPNFCPIQYVVARFLCHNFNHCPTKTKSTLYLSLVRPILEYAATLWAPYHHTDIFQLEAVQRRAAMQIYHELL